MPFLKSIAIAVILFGSAHAATAHELQFSYFEAQVKEDQVSITYTMRFPEYREREVTYTVEIPAVPPIDPSDEVTPARTEIQIKKIKVRTIREGVVTKKMPLDIFREMPLRRGWRVIG